jgi:hypothetical protein
MCDKNRDAALKILGSLQEVEDILVKEGIRVVNDMDYCPFLKTALLTSLAEAASGVNAAQAGIMELDKMRARAN